MVEKPLILVVDDDERIRDLLKTYLIENDFYCISAPDANRALFLIAHFKFDLITLDIMMQGMDGISLTKKIREDSSLPIILLTAKNEAPDRIRGLEAKASDYLAKPFEPKELLLRIHNIIEKNGKKIDIINFGEFFYNFLTKNLTLKNIKINLTSSEIILLEILLENKNKILSREQITKKMNLVSERTIDVQINRLRLKIENNHRLPEFLKTVRNKGYIFTI